MPMPEPIQSPTLVGWVRGDAGAARYLAMDRKTWVTLRRRHKVQPAIVGKTRRFECAALDRLMRSLAAKAGASDLLRPQISRQNRARAQAARSASATVLTSSQT